MRRSVPALLLACGFFAFSALAQPTAPPSSAPAPAYQSNPKFAAASAEGKDLERKHQYYFALEAYKKASKIAEGKDAKTWMSIINLQMKLGSYKDVAASSSALEAIVSAPEDKAWAETQRGYALYLQAGDKNKHDLLTEADASFQSALANNPKDATALYIDGMALARLGQMDAARDRFKGCVACVKPNDPSYVRAQHFAENPALSLQKMAPAFTVTALDGTHFNLDEMGGRVVLIDFWATWCGPCNEELPHMKQLAKDFAGEPLVIISVSWDSDEAKWRSFIDKNQMTWVQYRDADHALTNKFGINAIPHYFTIDADGVLTSEELGTGHDIEGKLKKLIARAKAEHPNAVAAEVTPGN